MGLADLVTVILAISFSMLIGATATAISMNLARSLNVMAVPDARGSHRVPTPRLGGVGYFLPLTIVLVVNVYKPNLIYIPTWGIEPALKTLFRLLLICGSVAFVVGLMDDLFRLPFWFKLLGQIAVAGLFVYLGSQIQYSIRSGDVLSDAGHVIRQGQTVILKGVGFAHMSLGKGLMLDDAWTHWVARMGKWAPHIPPLPVVVTFLWIVVLMNAYNFMDGIDGLAGVFAITVLLGLFALYLPEVHQTMALRAHLWVVMMLAAVLVGLSLGFLFYNWRGGWTFLGDCGSQYVGFVLAAILAQLTRVATEPAVNGAGEELDFLVRKRAYVDFPAAVILVFPFLYDVTYTLIRRLLHGKAVWRAHHEHLYQRLIDRGWSHKGVVLFNLPFYLLNSAIFVAYCWAQNTQVQRIWPGAGEGVATLLRHRGFWAAAALALMILYTLIVIAVEKIRPLAPAVAAEASAPTPAEPPAEAAPEAPGPADTPKI